MFSAGFLCGLNFGKIINSGVISSNLSPSKETLQLRDKISTFLKNNPYSTCPDIAKNINEPIPRINGILIGMVKNNMIKKLDNKFYV